MGRGKAIETNVPEETARVAQLAFPKPSPHMRMRDELGVIFQDKDYADLLSHTGRPAESQGALALVTLMQIAEGLSDRQAADAVRGRIDCFHPNPSLDSPRIPSFRHSAVYNSGLVCLQLWKTGLTSV